MKKRISTIALHIILWCVIFFILDNSANALFDYYDEIPFIANIAITSFIHWMLIRFEIVKINRD